MSGEYVLVYTTAGCREEAEKLAEALVAERLAACVKMTEVTSVYRWEGKTNRDEEILLSAKTTKAGYPDVEKRIKELHSYKCPEIIAVPIIEGSKDYLAWIREETII